MLKNLLLTLCFVCTLGGYLDAAPPPRPESAVRVYQMPNAAGEAHGGGGWVMWSDGIKQSLVVTNNHVMSADMQGPFRPAPEGTPCLVQTGEGKETKTYRGKVLVCNPELDTCVIVVDNPLKAVEFAKNPPKVGDKVYRYGQGSGPQECVVIERPVHFPNYTSPNMKFLVGGISKSGDSGSAYYDKDGKVVAIHCGAADNYPRGTPATYVKEWVVKEVEPRFPRLNKLLSNALKTLLEVLADKYLLKKQVVTKYTIGNALKFLPPPVKTAPRIVGYRQVCGVDQYGRRVCYLVPVYEAQPK